MNNGTTRLIVEAVKRNENLSDLKNDLNDITIEQFLKALIADCDAEELFILLALMEDIEVAGKPVKEVVIVADDDTETRYTK